MNKKIKIVVNQKPDSIDSEILLIANSGDITIGESLTSEEAEYIKKKIDQGEDVMNIISPGKSKFVIINRTDSINGRDLEKLRNHSYTVYKKLTEENRTSTLVVSSLQTQQTLAFIEGLLLSSYKFDKYKSDKKETTPPTIHIKSVQITEADINNLEAVCEGVFIARNLVNEPISELNAVNLATYIGQLGVQNGFEVTTLHKKDIENEKMGGLLGVNRGSVTPPTFTIIDWNPTDRKQNPIVLVGKGVTFDTGGINLKVQPGSLDDMKSDMAGAAAVVGTMVAVSRLNIQRRIVALIPATDNRPGFEALVPGDIITMHNGTTVEILNTDAEGRLILADAVSYAERFDPSLVIELSTLTGSAVMTLGNQGMAAMGTADDDTFRLMEETGYRVGERLARFPFWDEYDELLKSDIADLKNIGGREAGAITAGKFLARFTKKPFIHLDIAGVAFHRKDSGYRGNGATGVGVRLLTRFIQSINNKYQ